MTKAIIFDLDNTLIDFMTMKRMSVQGAISAMRDAGLNIDKDKAEKTMYKLYRDHGMEYQKVFQDFLQETTGMIDPKVLANAIIGYRRIEQGFMKPYPKVIHTLIKLKERGLKLAIVTDAPEMRAWLRLAETGLSDFFDVVVTLEDTHVVKPSVEPFKKALELLNLNPKNVLVVGDALEKDIKGAKLLGMKTCHARYGEVYPISKKIKPDFTIDSIEELLQKVDI